MVGRCNASNRKRIEIGVLRSSNFPSDGGLINEEAAFKSVNDDLRWIEHWISHRI
jgi:hypothetical protein